MCKNLAVYMQQQLHFQSEPAMEYGGIFGEEDNKFMFPNVIVGKKARARIKIANPTKGRSRGNVSNPVWSI